jgi:peptidase M28-like protein
VRRRNPGVAALPPYGAANGLPMKVARSTDRSPTPRSARIARVLRDVSPQRLRALVEMLAFPRHYTREKPANRKARDFLLKHARSLGYVPSLQGRYDNVVMALHPPQDGPFVLLGAHYDSVPGTPGADDNASAVAVCLECARLIGKHGIGPAMIVLFNREEDGLLGSSEFIAQLARHPDWNVKEAHIFEMVGYRDRSPGSQTLPPGLAVLAVRDVGDFLALLANRSSNAIAEDLLALAVRYIPDTPSPLSRSTSGWSGPSRTSTAAITRRSGGPAFRASCGRTPRSSATRTITWRRTRRTGWTTTS